MQKLIVTLSLAAVVVSSLAAGTPARAAEMSPQALAQLIQPDTLAEGLPQLAPPETPGQPDLGELSLRPRPLIDPKILFLRRAELTSQLFVFYGYHPVYNPHPIPGYPVIWCYVKNWGVVGSGWFKTLIRIHRKGFSTPLQGYIPMNLPAGGYELVGFRIWAPYGIERVFSYADATYLVPEYNEANNWDSIP
jgi:hypothetical protein